MRVSRLFSLSVCLVVVSAKYAFAWYEGTIDIYPKPGLVIIDEPITCLSPLNTISCFQYENTKNINIIDYFGGTSITDSVKSSPQLPILEIGYRDGWPGHAFFAVGYELNDGNTYFLEIAGFYPNTTGSISALAKGLILSDPQSVIAYKFPNDTVFDETIRVYLKKGEIEKIKQAIIQWQSKKYDLIQNNCVDLVYDFARIIDLEFGKRDRIRNLWPKNAIQAFKRNYERSERGKSGRPEFPSEIESGESQPSRSSVIPNILRPFEIPRLAPPSYEQSPPSPEPPTFPELPYPSLPEPPPAPSQDPPAPPPQEPLPTPRIP